MKPDCYKCKHKGGVAGSAHSSCQHPSFQGANNDPLSNVMAIFASVGRVSPVQAENKLNIKGNPHGIKKGWFNHPWNFDPVWVESCNGFEEKNMVNPAVSSAVSQENGQNAHN